MKKYLALLLALVMVLGLAACGSSGGGNSGNEQKTDIKLASHNAIIEGNPYRVRYEADIQEAAKAAKDHGLNVTYASFVSNWDAATESQQIENSINEGYDIILVDPVSSTGLDPIIEKAQEAGIIWINADCEYTSTEVNVLNISADQYLLGYETAKYAGEVLGKGAKVIMIAALDGNSANTDRQAGFQKGIEETGLVVVGGQYNHDWDAVKAQQIMTEILNTGLEFDGILISQCAEAALAAYDAVGAEYPKFIGFNDTGDFMKRMLELNKDGKKMDFYAQSNTPGVGATALNFGLNMILGKELKDDVYTVEEIHAIRLPCKMFYTYDDIADPDFVEAATTLAAGDTLTWWMTIDEVAAEYFK